MPCVTPSRMRLFFGIAAALAGALLASPDGKKLSLEWIALDSYKSVGMSPRNIHFSEDGSRIYFEWNPRKKRDPELYWVSAQGGDPQRVEEGERWKLPEGRGDRNRQGTRTVYAKFGDIFLLDIASGQARRILKTRAAESDPRFLEDGRRFTFERANNLFVYDIESGTLNQLTDIRSGKDPDAEEPGTEQEKFLKEQQQDLFDIVKRRKEDEERREARAKKQDLRPDPLYLGSKKKSVVELVPSPDGRFVGIVAEDRSQADKGRVPVMPRYVTDSGFVEADPIRRGRFSRVKVGAPIPSTRTGLYEVATGEASWVELDFGDRQVNHNRPVWAEDSSKFALVIGSADHKDRWIAVHDLQTGTTRIVDHERDEAWMRGLRSGRGNSVLGWLNDHDTLYYLSERSGWQHLYACRASTQQVTPLTSGRWEIDSIRLSEDKDRFYLTTTQAHPGERQLYSLPAQGGELTRITSREGWHRAELSPDESWIALSYSHSDRPAELAVMENRPRASMKLLTDSTTEEFKALELPRPQSVTFPDADGNLIYADLYRPASLEGLASRPAVLYIHGAGYTQAVYKRWSNARLLHHYLAQQGYLVLSLDYRGSRGYGRDCRTAIYRHMGGKDVDSALAAVEYLVQEQGVDRQRIGLYGGSYGGFYTLMALFQHPGVFGAGVARVPVTDWAHYNHGYTSRILNLPQDDEEAYRRSSPIYHADGLADPLLIVDGIEDNNVLVQDTMRLIQRLIELKKDSWEMHLYPVEPHGLRQETGRLDYYKRLARFFDRHLKN